MYALTPYGVRHTSTDTAWQAPNDQCTLCTTSLNNSSFVFPENLMLNRTVCRQVYF